MGNRKTVYTSEEEGQKLYAAYGEYAITFEIFCDWLRRAIIASVKFNGMKDSNIAEILISKMFAVDLLHKTRALCSIHYKDKPQWESVLKDYWRKCLSLIEMRNKIIHGTWHIPSLRNIDDMDESYEEAFVARAEGMKTVFTRKGFIRESYSYSVDDFEGLINLSST